MNTLDLKVWPATNPIDHIWSRPSRKKIGKNILITNLNHYTREWINNSNMNRPKKLNVTKDTHKEKTKTYCPETKCVAVELELSTQKYTDELYTPLWDAQGGRFEATQNLGGTQGGGNGAPLIGWFLCEAGRASGNNRGRGRRRRHQRSWIRDRKKWWVDPLPDHCFFFVEGPSSLQLALWFPPP